MSWAKILVIDDDPVIVQLGRQALEPDGFEVFAASSAGEGLALVQAEAPDLILTDLTLPDMSGFELCKRLQQDPQLCHIPIIIVTSRRRESDLVLSLGLGADDYVLKPWLGILIRSAVSSSPEAQLPTRRDERDEQVAVWSGTHRCLQWKRLVLDSIGSP